MGKGRTKFSYARQEPLTLRCDWCKGLFQWKPRSTDHVLNHLRATCSTKCEARLSSWRFNTQIASPGTGGTGRGK